VKRYAECIDEKWRYHPTTQRTKDRSWAAWRGSTGAPHGEVWLNTFKSRSKRDRGKNCLTIFTHHLSSLSFRILVFFVSFISLEQMSMWWFGRGNLNDACLSRIAVYRPVCYLRYVNIARHAMATQWPYIRRYTRARDVTCLPTTLTVPCELVVTVMPAHFIYGD